MNNKIIAGYAASFDPITNGHINVIKRMAPLYDELILFIAINERKKHMFSEEERKKMVLICTKDLPNVRVVISKDVYLVNHARQLGVSVIVRGLRNTNDLFDEMALFEANRAICPEIQTIWVPSWNELIYVSSSAVKSHVGLDPSWKNQVKKLVPKDVMFEINRKYTIEKARNYWSELVKDLGSPVGLSEQIEDILLNYCSNVRFYHAIEHIVNMLDELKLAIDKLELSKEEHCVLRLAIWYHDIVYNLQDKDGFKNENNELSSAKYFLDKIWKSKILTNEISKKVCDLIEFTDHKHLNLSNLGQILVDLDLTIFGQHAEVFDEYDQNIRKEYYFVPEVAYLEARMKILQRFLNKSNIYYTTFFKEKYEDMASQNLSRVICNIDSKLFEVRK